METKNLMQYGEELDKSFEWLYNLRYKLNRLAGGSATDSKGNYIYADVKDYHNVVGSKVKPKHIQKFYGNLETEVNQLIYKLQGIFPEYDHEDQLDHALDIIS
tara:strand:- start:64 stop:372 length:309 start_codon:yes stop_codon:yes gene_type:complete